MDILHRLGLTSQRSTDDPYEKTDSPPTTHTTAPSPLNVPFPGHGVTLDTDSLYEAPAGSLFPPDIGEEFSVVVSLTSGRANNAFLFSVKDARDRLRFGIQLLPRRVVVFTAEKASIYFSYDWQDGRQHPFAVGVRAHSVSFYADCGAVQQREPTLGRSQTLGASGGLFTLGRMNSKAAPFSGRVCQLDIYPSAQAAAHYCNYLKKQCRLADTYRSPSSHPGLDFEASDRPSDLLTKSPSGVGATHQTPIKATVAASVSSSTVLVQQSSSHLVNQSFVQSTVSSLQPDSPDSVTPSGLAGLSTADTTTQRMRLLGVQSEISTEGESSSGGMQTTHATGLISSAGQSHVKEGLRNTSIGSSGDAHQHPETHLRANGTTLYRENYPETSDQHDLDGSYEDLEMGGYDYGFEDADYFYDYEEGLRGPKGEPGPPVSDGIHE